jgi:hypothetical protein
MTNFDQKITDIAVMTFTSRHRNGRHSSRPEKDLIFAPPHFLKGTKNKLPTLNFSSRFLSNASFSTFAVYFLLCVEKITHNKKLAKPPTAKELNPSLKTKTRAKKFCLPTGASLTILCISTLLFSVDSFAQQPQTPKFESFEPVNTGQRYTNSKLTQQNYSAPNYPMGGHADQIINQQYQQASQMMGAPVYQPGMTPEQRQQANNLYIQQRMANDPAYQMPNSSNNFTQFALQREKEMMSMLNEITVINEKVNKSRHYASERYKNDFPNYQNAFNNLKDMLEGKMPLSLADALYMEEAAYGNLHMTYEEYKNEIKRSASFIKQWMLENGLNPKNPEHVHIAIQKFMGDTLHLKNNNLDNVGGLSLPKGHNPYSYDYIDYKAEKDLRNYFLTKTLATGTGQCHTLPTVYSVLAEALGVEASISFVHQHSFIKYKNMDGAIQNYEPTIDWHMTDNDYTEDLPVMSAAIASKIYLQPLTKKQMVASVMIDLAYNFHREHWIGDGKFMSQCIDYGMQYFHNNEGHREGLLLKNLVLASQLDRLLLKNGITDLNDIEKSPEAVQAYKEFRKSSDKIRELGIQHYPDDVYNAMLEKHDSRGKLQTAKGIDTKSKKSMFFNIQNN